MIERRRIRQTCRPINSNSELSEEELEDIKQSHNNWLESYAKEKMDKQRKQVETQRAKGNYGQSSLRF